MTFNHKNSAQTLNRKDVSSDENRTKETWKTIMHKDFQGLGQTTDKYESQGTQPNFTEERRLAGWVFFYTSRVRNWAERCRKCQEHKDFVVSNTDTVSKPGQFHLLFTHTLVQAPGLGLMLSLSLS